MRLLLDENISRRLVTELAEQFAGSTHVTAVGLERTADREVWQFARDNGFVIVSKDSDFNDLAFMHGPPPKVVWLRVGNATTDDIAAVLRDAADRIGAFVSNDTDAVLVVTGPGPERR